MAIRFNVCVYYTLSVGSHFVEKAIKRFREARMNYIELINNFWVEHRRFHFNDIETCMYFFLLDRANELYWPESFAVPNSTLTKEFGWTRSQIRRAREKLIEASLLSYYVNCQRKSGSYSLRAKVRGADSAQTGRSPGTDSAQTEESLHICLQATAETSETKKNQEAGRSFDSDPAQIGCNLGARSLYINKTKLKESKQELFLPAGETESEFPLGAGEDFEEDPRAGSHEHRTTPESLSPILPHEGETIPERATLPEESLSRESLTNHEGEIVKLWESLISPFERDWLDKLRETLRVCYPSQVKAAVVTLARTKPETLTRAGFPYLAAPLLLGAFGKRKPGGNSRPYTKEKRDGEYRFRPGEFESEIEKFKNPAREKPKSREELLKYTLY